MDRYTEKLTEAITLKIGDQMLRDCRAVAEAEGIETPELVRRIILDHLEKKRNHWLALSNIFGDCGNCGKENREGQGAIQGNPHRGSRDNPQE